MIDLRNLTEDQLTLLDTALVKYEFEIKGRLRLTGISNSEREKLDKELDILFQIYDHLQSSNYKIKDKFE